MSTLREVSGPGHFPRFLHLNGVSVYFCSLSRVRLYQAAVQTSGEQPERGGSGQTSAAPGVSGAAAQRQRTPLTPLLVPALHSRASGPVPPRCHVTAELCLHIKLYSDKKMEASHSGSLFYATIYSKGLNNNRRGAASAAPGQSES